MLHIMQDYGEVVCVVGSAANYENIGIFMQADARYVNFSLNYKFATLHFIMLDDT